MNNLTNKAIIIISIFLILLTGCTSEEKKLAVEEYDESVINVEKLNDDLDALIAKADTLVETSEKALDDEAIGNLESTLSQAKSQRKEIPEIPKKLEEILSTIESLDEIDYTVVSEDLDLAMKHYTDSVKQYNQVTSPSESFVLERLEEIKGITGISAVTEDNDPNGNLGKAGSYTAQVFFTHELVDQTTIFGDSIIEKGTPGGGSIEVYSTVEEAKTRDDYLSAFDGGVLASGSHTVIGTLVIRTSDELTASQQNDLENNLIEAMIMLK